MVRKRHWPSKQFFTSRSPDRHSSKQSPTSILATTWQNGAVHSRRLVLPCVGEAFRRDVSVTMDVIGDYDKEGYALIQQLVTPEIAKALLATLKADLGPGDIPLSEISRFPNLLKRPAFEIYGHHYTPMNFFLWGLTPIMRQITGRDLLPTYDYFRIYREGDICRVHHDRPSCEHSLSLTLDYSDGVEWPLEVATVSSQPSAQVEEDFGDEPFASITMEVGDAVLYRGIGHRHGRTMPNPNAWSAHLFLHWVDRNGPQASEAFDRQHSSASVNFHFT